MSVLTTSTTSSSGSQVVVGTLITGERAWLSPAAAASYQQMQAAGMPAGGITSAGRSSAAQAGLYQAYLNGTGNLAAKPGTSPHEKGIALDMNVASSAHRWLLANGAKYGWTQAVPGEPWHWQYGGAAATKSNIPVIGGLIDGAKNVVGDVTGAVTSGVSSALGLNDIATTATSVLLRIVFVVGGVGLVVLGLGRMVASTAAGQKIQTLGDQGLSTVTGGLA
ncbi:MAG: hypothetical protein BGO37_10900 [Cellulomonas sp. 73-92]|nr:MAG: hypothetical protein BGO37_10900 [Cellulomonas sp. 73-92]